DAAPPLGLLRKASEGGAAESRRRGRSGLLARAGSRHRSIRIGIRVPEAGPPRDPKAGSKRAPDHFSMTSLPITYQTINAEERTHSIRIATSCQPIHVSKL